MTRLLTFTLLGVLGLSASCMGPSTDDAGSGGSAASGGSGGTPGSGGSSSGGLPGSGATPGTTGGSAGSAGSAGAAGAPTCDCPEDTHLTIELPDGPRVYELSSAPDSCNLFPCEPPGVSVSLGSWRHDHYSFRACHPEGDCIYLDTDDNSFTSTEGEVMVWHSGVMLEEPVTMEMTVLEGDGHTTVEVTFESAPEAGISFSGTGRACLVASQSICAI